MPGTDCLVELEPLRVRQSFGGPVLTAADIRAAARRHVVAPHVATAGRRRVPPSYAFALGAWSLRPASSQRSYRNVIYA